MSSLFERLRRASPLLVVVASTALVAAGQLTEDAADSAPLQMLEPANAIRRWTIVLAVLYMVGISRVVDRLVERSIGKLEAVLDVHGDRFAGYALRMARPRVRQDVALLVASIVVVFFLFVALGSSLPTVDPVTGGETFVPSGAPAALLVLAEYAIVGWALVSLAYCTVRRARALGQLSREPLEVDVFDTTNLLPLGNIALATALAPAGIIVILLFGFGRPSGPLSWSVLLLVASSSIVALLLPLRGIHHQMAREKHRVLASLNGRIREIYGQLDTVPEDDAGETARLNNRATLLIGLRKTVGEMTTWPFRDTLAFGRALLIASAPLIYTVISELIKVFWIRPLTP